MITIEQLKDVKDRTEKLYRYLGIESKQIEVEEEQLRTQAPGFWDDAKAAEAQMKKVKALQQWIDGYKEVKTLTDEVETAFDFYKEELVTESEVDDAFSITFWLLLRSVSVAKVSFFSACAKAVLQQAIIKIKVM